MGNTDDITCFIEEHLMYMMRDPEYLSFTVDLYKALLAMNHVEVARHGYKMTAAYHADMAKLRDKYEYGPRRK